MTKAITILVLSLLLAAPVSALGRYDIQFRSADYDSGPVVVDEYPPAPYSCFKDAGIMPGDVLIKMNGRKINSPRDFSDAMDSVKPGEKIKVRVSRGRKNVDVVVGTIVEDFSFLKSFRKLVTKGQKVKVAVVVTAAYDEKDRAGGAGERAENARRFWPELLYKIMGGITSREDWGKYTALLALSDAAVSAEASAAFKDRVGGPLMPAEMAMIKEKTGASHVITVEYSSSSPDPGRVVNKVDLAIVDLSTGNIVDQAKLETTFDASDGRLIKSTVNGYERPVFRWE